MINVYFNYPRTHVEIHHNSDCPKIHMHHKENQRQLKLNLDTFQTIIRDFTDGTFKFKAEAGLNDVWLEIDFNDLSFEKAVVEHIILLLGKRYSPFNNLFPEID